MKLSSTQSNLIGTIGNLGMYAAGVPVGILVDTKGPKPGVILGGICLGVGFLALRQSKRSEILVLNTLLTSNLRL